MNGTPRSEAFSLHPGSPVLAVGFTLADGVPSPGSWPKRDPWLVFVGRLIEPFRPGLALLMAPGPLAASISPKGVDRVDVGVAKDGSALVSMARSHPDERGAIAYLVLEDRANRVEVIEHVPDPSWPFPLFFADDIRRAVKTALLASLPASAAFVTAPPPRRKLELTRVGR